MPYHGIAERRQIRMTDVHVLRPSKKIERRELLGLLACGGTELAGLFTTAGLLAAVV